MSNKKLFRLSDLYWTAAWFCTRAFYTLAGLRTLFFCTKLRGRLKSFAAPARTPTYQNLMAVFGRFKTEKEVRAIVRRHFEYQEMVELEFLLPGLKRFSHPRFWPVDGLQHLDQALARGRGVILLSTHFGYSRSIRHFLRVRGYAIMAVGAKAGVRSGKRYKKGRELTREGLTRFGKFMYQRLQLDRTAHDFYDISAHLNVRPLVQALGDNRILFIEGDGLHSANFIEIEIVGHPVPFPTGAMSMALATGAAVLPAFAVDAQHGGIEVFIEKPLELQQSGDVRKDSAAGVQAFARIFESYVLRYPHLYRWSRENWLEKRRRRSRSDIEQRYNPQLASS